MRLAIYWPGDWPERIGSMKRILEHVDGVVRPALRKYVTAEQSLTAAIASTDAIAIDAAHEVVKLAARQAAVELHHLADFVLKEPSSSLRFADIVGVRSAVEAKCVFLRTSNPVADVSLLRDIADAFKHHHLDRPSATVASSTDIAPVSLGFGEIPWGEGKFGGAEQFVVTKKNGDRRALSSVLQNVFDAWMTLLRQPLPPISEY
jgi:hypothetical protein